MATSNFAENHPVGFQWVMKAKERGAKFIHVDPRFTRTSAVADIHVPLRSGTNIAFFGGLISYAIAEQPLLQGLRHPLHQRLVPDRSRLQDRHRRRRALHRPRADRQGRRRPARGRRPTSGTSWKYQLDGEGNPKRDLTLRDPRTVFQLMKRHYSRYTPEMVERVCGIPKEKFVQVAKLYCENSGPEKTGTITYALNLTQHTNGVQNIRALCMLQILLGNIGRPGGGVVALRGHANVQGATDLELLYHELPGYLPMPLRELHPGSQDVSREGDAQGRLLGEPAQVHGEPAQGVLRRRGHRRERLRLPVAAQAGLRGRLQPPAHVRGHVQGRHQGLPRRRAEPGGGWAQRQARPRRHAASSTGWW